MYFESFLTWAQDGVGYTKPLARPLTLQKESGFLSCRRLGGPRCRSGQVWKRKRQSHTRVRTPPPSSPYRLRYAEPSVYNIIVEN
jgi:hypothetical protein